MRILMIEDDVNLCEVVSYALEQEGYAVDICHEGDDGLRWMEEQAHDLVILDRMLPRLNGVRLLSTARKKGVVTPVLMVTALGSMREVIEGLDCGADDYIVKPFAIEELLARVRAMSRRPQVWTAAPQMEYGEVTLDPGKKSLKYQEKECGLSKREFDLLSFLLKNKGVSVPRGTLLSYVWGPDSHVEEGNIENYIHFLRRRLISLDCPLAIRTVRGMGYCLEEKDV